ncbi:NADH-quinone oxidoreductase subunit C [Magnetospirillum sp. UT-4]|uniref:NADH-quinone oxidoreductase subunit C n=1 Tax=Magnetospirillum sp. UT-4 TaxID=2681467 RepID=UPI0013800B49|nr:NADH-quinone oxidoreductase subunit C [Magnetospirillum sp. UT-4]CAA7615303.1 NADH dehydrogenase subunit C [Magnetospirillum sp. UT-4]
MRALLDSLKSLYPLDDIVLQRPDLAFATVPAAQVRGLLHHLKEREGFTHLVLLTAVDWLEDGMFQLTYLLHDRARARDLGLRTLIRRDRATMDGIHDLWPTAATYQRELKEMFGIDFPGSPGVDDPFVLEGWTDLPPYRRDFDTKDFSERNFNHREGRVTHDPAAHMKRHLYPDEA